MHEINPELFARLNQPIPRYTSYPTAPEWHELQPVDYELQLKEAQGPISAYVHIPFCQTMCLFCGCSVILNRNPDREKTYIDYLIREIDLVSKKIGKKTIAQLHFGGGTPTKISIELLDILFKKITSCFEIDFNKEVAIEIDPRTVYADQGEKLRFLKQLGFNRVSFGVQDLNPHVQEAVRRRQSKEMTFSTYFLAKELAFSAINIDLIYGLPLQTVDSFKETIQEIIALKPDRIALFSYAKVPWLKPHQKAISENDLPTSEEKFQIYVMARSLLVENGYIAIGMDHFALLTDELANAYLNKQLQRNFQGYSLKLAEHHIGLGVTAIGMVNQGYFQNHKNLEIYYQKVEQNILPIERGKILSKEDLLRKWVIHTLMCNFELDKNQFFQKFECNFDQCFFDVRENLEELAKLNLIKYDSQFLKVTSQGELFIRNIAVLFDQYFQKKVHFRKFSQAI